MPTALSKPQHYESIAKKYSEINELQVQWSKELAGSAGIKPGDRVLDMGCGTGELTSYLANLVGKDGEVVAVDPDFERIKVACEKHPLENIIFENGESSKKKIFVQTAFNCLKPGGMIAIQSHDKEPEIVKEFTKQLVPNNIENNQPTVHLLEKADAEELLRNSGFVILSSKYSFMAHKFQNIAEFSSWVYASDYWDVSKLSTQNMTNFAS
ncbi:Hypothetical predicted protein, partial [Paramuricea clavata]